MLGPAWLTDWFTSNSRVEAWHDHQYLSAFNVPADLDRHKETDRLPWILNLGPVDLVSPTLRSRMFVPLGVHETEGLVDRRHFEMIENARFRRISSQETRETAKVIRRRILPSCAVTQVNSIERLHHRLGCENPASKHSLVRSHCRPTGLQVVKDHRSASFGSLQ